MWGSQPCLSPRWKPSQISLTDKLVAQQPHLASVAADEAGTGTLGPADIPERARCGAHHTHVHAIVEDSAHNGSVQSQLALQEHRAGPGGKQRVPSGGNENLGSLVLLGYIHVLELWPHPSMSPQRVGPAGESAGLQPWPMLTLLRSPCAAALAQLPRPTGAVAWCCCH